MLSKRSMTAVAVTLVISMSLQSGAAFGSASPAPSAAKSVPVLTPLSAAAPAVTSRSGSQAIYNDFLKLVKQPERLQEAAAYVDQHIGEVSQTQAGNMVLRLENAQKNALNLWVDKMSAPGVQESIAKLYKHGDSFTNVIYRTNDWKLRSLLKSARDSGYKLETAEGMFFPIIDYKRYEKYRPYVRPSIQQYIDIMSVESEAVPYKDAALFIPWEEVISRALSQEAYLSAHSSSNRAKEVKQLYNQYLITSFYGLSNTPLFDYDDKRMDQEAREAFEKLLQEKDTSSSPYLTKLKGFMDVLKKNDYKLNSEGEQYRKKNAPIN